MLFNYDFSSLFSLRLSFPLLPFFKLAGLLLHVLVWVTFFLSFKLRLYIKSWTLARLLKYPRTKMTNIIVEGEKLKL